MRGYTSAHPLFDEKPAQEAPAIPLNPTVESWDVQRLGDNTRHVLARLRQGPATGPELLSPEIGGIGFKQRVHELRKAGYAIKTTHVKGGVYEYRLLDRGEPGNVRDHELTS